MKIPCEKCITLAMCKSSAYNDQSILSLLHKCSLMRNHIKPCTYFINANAMDNKRSIYKVRKANKILIDLYILYDIKIMGNALYSYADNFRLGVANAAM